MTIGDADALGKSLDGRDDRPRPTPGPWAVENVLWLQEGVLHETYPGNDRGAEYLVNVGTDSEYVAICYGDDNARLIAAAPDLLAALTKAHACGTLRDDGTCDGCFASEAIAKATGRP